MALHIRPVVPAKGRLLITTVIAVFALVAQPFYGMVQSQVASAAAVTDHVVINEIMANPGTGNKEWIELYNPTDAVVDMSGWRIKDGDANFSGVFESGVTISPKSFVVREASNTESQLHNSTQELRLVSDSDNTLIHDVTYSGIAEGKSYARSHDAATTWVSQADPTKGFSNGSATSAESSVVGTAFVTKSDEKYAGVFAEFTVAGFTDASDAYVTIERSSGGSVVKHIKNINLINGANGTITAPFAIVEGTYKDNGSSSWHAMEPNVWTKDTVPEKAYMTVVTPAGNKPSNVVTLNTTNRPGYESLLPAARNVNDNLYFGSIQEAIDADTTSSNETIEVFDGTHGAFTVNGKGNLVIKAAEGANPVIEASAPNTGRIIDIRANGTTIEGLTVRSANPGANVGISLGGSDLRVLRNTVEYTLTGIQSTTQNSVGDSLIKGNTIRNSKVGISLQNDSNHVINNDITSSVEGFGVIGLNNLIEFNDIRAESGVDAAAYGGITLDITKNWWSSQAGPGTVQGDVVAQEWLCQSFEEGTRLSADGSCEDITPPEAPSTIYVYKGHNSDAKNLLSGDTIYTNSAKIRIAWNPSVSDDVEFYHFGTKHTKYHREVAVTKRDSNGNLYYDANMTPGHNPYYFTAIAVDGAGNESVEAKTKSVILDIDAPAKPAGLHRIAKVGGKKYECNAVTTLQGLEPRWAAYSGDDFSHYNYETRKGHKVSNIKVNRYNIGSWVPTEEGINGFRVQTVDKAGNTSAWSDWCDTAFDSKPPIVTLEDVIVNDGSLSFQLKATDAASGLKHVAANIVNASGERVISLGKNAAGNPGSLNQTTRLNMPFSGWKLGEKHEFEETFTDIDVSSLAPGTYTIRGHARDHADLQHRWAEAQFTVVEPAPVLHVDYLVTHNDHFGIGFRADGFKDATSVVVELRDAEGGVIATNVGNNEAVQSLLNGSLDDGITSPFWVLNQVDSDDWWNFDMVDWANVSEPATAWVTIYYGDNEEVSGSVGLTVAEGGLTYAQLMALYAESQKKNENNTNTPQFLRLPTTREIGLEGDLPSASTPASLAASIFGSQAIGSPAGDSEDGEVLGSRVSTPGTAVPQVMGASVADADSNGMAKFLGLAWYWWVMILAGLGLAGWGIATVLRHRREDAELGF